MPNKSRSMAHPWLNGWKLRKNHLKCLDPNTSEGQVARWMWQGPGKVQLNVSCLEAWLVGDFERECGETSYLLHMIVYDWLWWFMIAYADFQIHAVSLFLPWFCMCDLSNCRCFMAHISFAPKDGSRLDFYILSGDHAEMRRRQRGQHEPMKDCWTGVEKSRSQTGKTGQKRPTFVIYSCKMIKIQVLKCTTNVCLGHEQVKIIWFTQFG